MSQRGGHGGRGQPPPYRGGGRGVGRGRGRGSAPPPQSSFSSQSPFTPSPSPSPSFAPSSSSPVAPPSFNPVVGSTSSPNISTLTDKVTNLSLQTPTPTPTPTRAVDPPSVRPPESSKALAFPRRPGFGTSGTKCAIRANHFLVKLQEKDLHHYDVSIKPEVISRGVNRAVMKQLVSDYGGSHLGRLNPVYDGRKGLYTAGPLPFTSKEFLVKLVDKGDDPTSIRRERQFEVSIKFAAKTDLYHLQQFLSGRGKDSPQDTIQALDIVLRESPSNKFSVIGRSFFSLTLGPKADVGEGLECWRGYYQSIRPTQMGMSLNIDVAATSFYEAIPIIEFVQKLLGRKDLSRPISDVDRMKIKKAVRGLRVELTHSKKRHKISGVTAQAVNQLMFTVDESGRKISVAQYFAEKYGQRLHFAHLPALQAGTDSKPSYFPFEVCKIVEGQRYSKKLNERQVSSILKASCKRPSDREKSICDMVVCNNYRNDLYAREFGIDVDSRPATIPSARVLQPPMLQYHKTGKEVRVQPRLGQWNMINTRMVNGATVNHWTAVNFSRLTWGAVDDFIRGLIGMCVSKGMVFNPTPLVEIKSAPPQQIEKTLVEIHRQSMSVLASRGETGGLQLLIVILPDSSGQYGKIKRICETELGIVSQCCQPRQAQKLSKQYMENVSLKINVKAGGRNNVLVDALMRSIPLVSGHPTIIFGADVTHPHPGEDSSPSIAAVVASMDWPEITKYRGLVSAQQHRQELIQDLYKVDHDRQKGVCHSGMIRELLRSFRKSTGQKPERIIFYRDGVSEGQFSQVLMYELDAIRKACSSLQDGYLPPVTFVVVQKRHHTRLFPAEHGNRNLTDKSGNVLPGTVVDTHICHPTEFDFYLCSHAGIQGTSRPTHYHVLWDENKFTADQLQNLTNSLCYTYARCTRSVSVVPPAYYAHLAAFRARYYMESDFPASETSPGGNSGNAEIRRLPAIKDNVKDVMFFC